jgi:hypothetical protein
MERRSLDRYVWLGMALRYLRDAREGTSVHGAGFVLGNLKEFKELLPQVALFVSERGTGWSGLDAVEKELEATEEDAKLTALQAIELSRAASDLSTTVLSESSGTFGFIVTDKRVSTDTLLDHPETLFASGVFDALPAIAQDDFRTATRCIAFELPTSAAFHLMRATEAVLRGYYCAVIKRNRIKVMLWGPMVEHLRQRKTDPPPTALLDHLDSIRINFRNPTQHPDGDV